MIQTYKKMHKIRISSLPNPETSTVFQTFPHKRDIACVPSNLNKTLTLFQAVTMFGINKNYSKDFNKNLKRDSKIQKLLQIYQNKQKIAQNKKLINSLPNTETSTIFSNMPLQKRHSWVPSNKTKH